MAIKPRTGRRPRAAHLAAARLAAFSLTAAFACGVVSGFSTRFTRAAAAEIDPQDAEFLASVNRIIADSAQPASQTGYACDRIVATAINVDAIAERAMGETWVRLSQHQRAAFRMAARRWAVRDCIRHSRGNEGGPLELLGLKQGEDGERLMSTRSGKPVHTIIWRLHGAGKARAVDVVVDGRSAVLSLRSETKALLGRANDDIDVATEMLGR
jgi:MlaC protein